MSNLRVSARPIAGCDPGSSLGRLLSCGGQECFCESDVIRSLVRPVAFRVD